MGLLRILFPSSKVTSSNKADKATRKKKLSHHDDEHQKPSNKNKPSSSNSRKTTPPKSPTKKETKASSSRATPVPQVTINTSSTSTRNEQAIVQYFETLNRLESIESILSFYATPNVTCTFEDGFQLKAQQKLEMIFHLAQSFPNFQLNFTTVEETEPNKVMVELLASGTHTGKPYAFAAFPPVDTTHRHVILDQEIMWFEMTSDGKIGREQIVALGNLTGPAGFYMSIGGSLKQLPTATTTED